MPKSGKNALAARAKVDREKLYSPEEAIEVMRDSSFAKFDETVEVHARLGIDPRQADQAVDDGYPAAWHWKHRAYSGFRPG